MRSIFQVKAKPGPLDTAHKVSEKHVQVATVEISIPTGVVVILRMVFQAPRIEGSPNNLPKSRMQGYTSLRATKVDSKNAR